MSIHHLNIGDKNCAGYDGRPYDFPTKINHFESCDEFQFTNALGCKLFARAWEVHNPKAAVIFQHGVYGHQNGSAKDENGTITGPDQVFKILNARGISVYSLDAQGHGYSEGKWHFVNDYKENINDLEQFVTKEVAARLQSDTPIFLMGESWGAQLVFGVALRLQEKKYPAFQGCLFVSPAFAGDLPPLPAFLFLRYVVPQFVGLDTVPFFMPHPISAERLWDNATIMETSRASPLGGRDLPFSIGTALQLVQGLEDTIAGMPEFRSPFLILHGSEDHGVPVSGSEDMMKESSTDVGDKKLHICEGAMHCMLESPHWFPIVAEKIGEWTLERAAK